MLCTGHLGGYCSLAEARTAAISRAAGCLPCSQPEQSFEARNTNLEISERKENRHDDGAIVYIRALYCSLQKDKYNIQILLRTKMNLLNSNRFGLRGIAQ